MTDVQWISAGLLVRRSLRIALLKAGVKFREPERGLFVIDDTPAVYAMVMRSLRQQGLLTD